MNYPSNARELLVAMGYADYCGDFRQSDDGTLELLAWVCDGEPPTPADLAAFLESAEYLAAVKAAKIAALRAEREAHVTSLYSSVVVEDAALGIPSAAFKDKVIADRTQCALDLRAALDAVSAATTPAEVAAVAIAWTITAGANPDAPEYAV